MATNKVAHKYTGLNSLFEQQAVTVYSAKANDQVGTKTVTKSGYYPVCMAGYSLSGTVKGPRVFRMRLVSSAAGTTTIQYSVAENSLASETLTVYINWIKIT